MSRWTTKDLEKKGLRISGQVPDISVCTPIPGKIFIPKNVPSKKNSKRITTLGNGKKTLLSSKTCYNYERETSSSYRINKEIFQEMTKDLKPPFNVFFKLIRKDKQRFDYNNILQMVQDMMVSFEWLEDDNANFLIPVIVPYEIDKKNPGVFIWV